ncbi:metallophosphoesterase [Actinoplanes friuliensis]|uniref:Metallophosphoesterase n=1 Tax=Actinoplanes friuliensis DSM 7358 TaxID=1246995 RepID=U5W5K8_9ACTN|nr:metallophosphoesterase [Actinoplanes friuliensis]AGZ44292.1 metallophosphoesterase [Actinoplanes friuliensis DSM 7358]
MTRIVVVGDVGGCVTHLAEAMAGVVEDEDTVVVQVGDLVDRGPDSTGVLRFVAERLATAPRRWIQLIGNHEEQYLDGEVFWPEPISDEDTQLLRSWWLRDRIRVAAALRTADGEEFLLTHAALTVDAWNELGAPVTAGTAADLLNTRPEELLRDERGPLWAEAGSDVYESWLRAGVPPPFGQVHGHSTIVDFPTRTWRCGERIRQRSTVDWDARHTVTRIGGARFIGCDPRHGRTGAPRWSPLVFEGATLLG